MTRLPFTISNQSLTFFVKGRPYSLTRDHEHYAAARAHLVQTEVDHDAGMLIDMVDIRGALMRESHGRIVFDGNSIIFGGKPLNNIWVDKILELRGSGEDFSPFWNALDRLVHNPTPAAIERLPIFLERTKLGFLPDGRFIAFKGVGSDLRSKHSNLDGTYFTHEIGAKPRMAREDVDADPNRTCSTGLHVGAPDYVRELFNNGQVVLVAVDPVDVVAVPIDYRGEKMRVCGYEVIDHLEKDWSDELLGRMTAATAYSSSSWTPAEMTEHYDAQNAEIDAQLEEEDEEDEEEEEGAWTTGIKPDDLVEYGDGTFGVVIEIDEGYLSIRDVVGEPSTLFEDQFFRVVPDDEATASMLACVGAVLRIEDDSMLDDGDYIVTGLVGDYGERQVDENDFFFEVGDQNTPVLNRVIKAVTYRGEQLWPRTKIDENDVTLQAHKPQVGDRVQIGEGGWPPAGIYPVIDTSPTGVIVQTEHDGKVFVNEAQIDDVLSA